MSHSTRCLEKELLDLLGPGRDSQIAARYYGFDGRGGKTLLTVGQEYGLTRERVRQVVVANRERLGQQQPIIPILDRTVTFVVNRLPAVASEIELELKSYGLTSNLFRLDGIINAIELLFKPLRFEITEVGGTRIAHAPGSPAVPIINRVARRLIARRGMATLSDVLTKLGGDTSRRSDKNFIAVVLAQQRGFGWLDRAAGWFWLSDSYINPILNRIRKILSVAKAVEVSELAEGIARDYRMDAFSPPKEVLLEFCRQSPGLNVRNSTIRATPGINPDHVLTQSERSISGILAERGGTLAFWELKEICLENGMTRASLFKCLNYSPILSEEASGLYRLIGSKAKAWYFSRNNKPKGNQSERCGVDTAIFPSGLLQVTQVSTILGISPRAVHYHANSGALRGKKIGQIWHFQIQDVYKFKTKINSLKRRGLSRIRITS